MSYSQAAREKGPVPADAQLGEDPGVLVVHYERDGRRFRRLAEGEEFTFLDGLVLLRWTEGPVEGHVVVFERLDERMPEQFRGAHRGQAVEEVVLPSSASAKIPETSLLYDLLNVTSLASFEHLSRKFQLISAGHANNSLNPVYAGAEFYGGDDGEELLAPELRRKVLERMKTQAKVLEVQQKQKELKVPLPRGPKRGQKGDKT